MKTFVFSGTIDPNCLKVTRQLKILACDKGSAITIRC